jgi:predicted nucleic acid-binding protein
MIVFVETNFFLELGLEQEQAAPAQLLLERARQGKCDLRFPAFSITEAITAFDRRRSDRGQVANAINKTVRKLKRSVRPTILTAQSLDVVAGLAQANSVEFNSLRHAILEALSVGRAIPADSDVLATAFKFVDSVSLSLQDAIVAASVIVDSSREEAATPKIFASCDVKAFDIDLIKDQFQHVNCKFLNSFKAVAGIIDSSGRP